MNKDTETITLHFKYCALIAVMVIIAIATERWSSSKEFTTYLSNAATMTSLFLGVVAILYSFVSNDSMSRSLGSISTITAEVKEARDDIEEFLDLTKQATTSSAANTQLIQGASNNLTSSLELLQQTLGAISSQNETMQALVSNLPTKIDQLDAKMGDFVKASGEKPQKNLSPATPADLSAKVVQNFLERSTLNQNLLAIACVEAYAHSKPLSVIDFTKTIEWDAPNMITGYLACMHAVQLCTRKSVDKKERTYSISNIHPEIQAQAKSYFVAYIRENFSPDSDDQEIWLRKMANVESLYSVDSQQPPA